MSIIGQERRITFALKEAPATGRRAVMSSSRVDRVGDVIEQTGWNLTEFLKNPVMLYDHDRSVPVGVWRDVKVEGATLTGEPVFHPEEINPLAGRLAKLYAGGWLKAFSVGFRVTKARPNPDGSGWVIEEAELYECSAVTIPANTDALMKAGPGARMVSISGAYKGLDALKAGINREALARWAPKRETKAMDIEALLGDPEALRRIKVALGSLDEQPQPPPAGNVPDDGAGDGEDEDQLAVALAEAEAAEAEAELAEEIENES